MMKCNGCGKVNEEKHKYCFYCGSPLVSIPIKNYPNCKTCKWQQEYEATYTRCEAQGRKSIEIAYGTQNCFGVYESKY